MDWNEGTSVISSDGWVVSEVGAGTGVAWADLDLAASRDKRLTEHAHLGDDRRPNLYRAVSPTPRPPGGRLPP